MLYVVGTGICEQHLTKKAINLIENADVVYGSKKALENVEGYIKCSEVREIKNFNPVEYQEIEREGTRREVVVLSTGDPMVSGLGTKIEGEIVSGISSVQLALNRLNLDLTEVIVVKAHNKKPEKLLDLLKLKPLLILADRNFEVSMFGEREVIILENLCMKDERIRTGKAREMKLESDYTLVYVK